MAAKFPIALVQMRAGTQPAQNLIDASAMIREAAAKGAQLVCTPENTHLIQSDRSLFLQNIHAEKDEPALTAFCDLAKELGIFLLLGSLAIKLTPGKAANRSFLINPQGEIVARYDKIHLFDVTINDRETWRESDYFRAGSRAVITQAGPATLGLSICYDLRFATLYRLLAQNGANVLTVPSAFTRVTGRAHWEVLLRARAIECGAYVLAPAQGGVHEDGRRTWGHSMVVDPWGEVIAILDHDAPGVLLADLDLQKCVTVRQRLPALTLDAKYDLS
ncbi:MAG: carbon-nitrogen hydrolase family protein [Robiginitomaculum sp.]|nr:carbon-nitrogen hydrolase family protein [Robiginitomaculum sp.]MDQ7076782.1 carbon-nitrogen hydrolase family protein [Robiginitomaculum sp.]